jgi:broad specificity phosphatase PhoE
MKKSLAFILLIAVFACNTNHERKKQDEKTTTVYYLIRHAEKDRSDPENKDPKLTEEGLLRAQRWSEIFDQVEFDQIYSTDYQRTRQTVLCISKRKNIPIETYDPNDLYNNKFKERTHGNTVLIVGHSNTTPGFVNAILEKEHFEQMDDSNNGNLYIVTIIGDQKNVELLTFN